MELFRENKRWFLAVKNSTFLSHYPRKAEYLQSILKTSLKKAYFFVIEGKIYLIIMQYYAVMQYMLYQYPAIKHPGLRTITTEK